MIFFFEKCDILQYEDIRKALGVNKEKEKKFIANINMGC
jgi:hypothetical protein